LATLSDVDAKALAVSAVTTQADSTLTISTQQQQPADMSDDELGEIVKDWGQLPEILKRALIEMVRASAK